MYIVTFSAHLQRNMVWTPPLFWGWRRHCSNIIEIFVESALCCTVNLHHFILFSFTSSHNFICLSLCMVYEVYEDSNKQINRVRIVKNELGGQQHIRN